MQSAEIGSNPLGCEKYQELHEAPEQNVTCIAVGNDYEHALNVYERLATLNLPVALHERTRGQEVPCQSTPTKRGNRARTRFAIGIWLDDEGEFFSGSTGDHVIKRVLELAGIEDILPMVAQGYCRANYYWYEYDILRTGIPDNIVNLFDFIEIERPEIARENEAKARREVALEARRDSMTDEEKNREVEIEQARGACLSDYTKSPGREQPMLLEGFLMKGGINMMYGQSDLALKSFGLGNMLIHGASGGGNYGGYNLSAIGGALVVNTEGIEDTGKRYRVGTNVLGISDPLPIRATGRAYLLDTAIGYEELRAHIREIHLPEMKVIDVLGLDTLRGCMRADDTNTAAFGELTRNCRELIREFGLTIIIVHHPTKGSIDTIAGSYAVQANTDSLVHITGNGESWSAWHCKRLKEGRKNARLGFDVSEHTITHFDENGSELTETSLALTPVDFKDQRNTDKDVPKGPETASKVELAREKILAIVRERPGIKQSEIADKTGYSKSTVSRRVKELVDAGEVTDFGDDGLFAADA